MLILVIHVLVIIENVWCKMMCFHHQDFERPSPPQKPLPADPLGRSSCLARSITAGVHVPGRGPLPIPIPTVPRPAPAMPLPSRRVVLNLLSWPHLPALRCESPASTNIWVTSAVSCFYLLSAENQLWSIVLFLRERNRTSRIPFVALRLV